MTCVGNQKVVSTNLGATFLGNFAGQQIEAKFFP